MAIRSGSVAAERGERGSRHRASEREAERKRRLATNKRLATGLLAGMGGVFTATLFVPEPGLAVMLVRSAAEAGVVGGLADWFAVTALFHRPLGLPIPHTAIVPNSKERIGQALSHFVEEYFLTRDILLRRLEDAEAGRRVAAWLAEPRTAGLLSGWVAAAVPALLRSLDSPELRDFVSRALGDRLQRADIAPGLGRLLRLFTTSPESDAVFDTAIDAAARWLDRNQGHLELLVHEHSRWWVPKAFNRRLAKAVLDGLGDLLGELRRPDSEARARLRHDLAALVEGMLSSPARRAAINESVQRILGRSEVQDWLRAVWADFSQSAVGELEQPSSRMRLALERAVAEFGKNVATDPAMRAHVDNAFRKLALSVVLWRREIGKVITEIVRSWDASTVSARLELAVGSDLQYIRMNGTVVGAGVGCLIYLATLLLAVPA